MQDMNLSCRTCMKSNVTLVHIYESIITDENSNIQLSQLLLECASLHVIKDDGLPQNLCEECIKILQLSYAFRSQAARVEEQFKILLNETVKTEIKTENELEQNYDDFSYDNFAYDNDELKFEPDVKDDNIIIENIETFTCPTCNKSFTKESKYLKHLQLHNLQFQCTYCNKKFLRKGNLKKHLLKHENKCQICNTVFPDEAELFQHIATHNVATIKDEPVEKLTLFPCDCGKSFTNIRSLTLHQKKHKKDEQGSYTCDVCQKEFSSKSLVKRHLRLHVKEHPLKCMYCSKSYSRSDQLKVHMKTHSEEKAHICSFCNKAFTQICSLKDHIRIHTGETPYLCSQCGKGFANSSNLRQHMFRHTGVKPHACKLCPKTFSTKGQMTAHLVTHSGAHPYSCGTCGAAFTKPSSLKKHAFIHTGQRPHACDTCHMRFTCKDHLKRHSRTHTGEKPYRCRYCERAFMQSNDLVKHMRGHLGDNIYECSVCDMRFRLKSELTKHYPIHFNEDGSKDMHAKLTQTLNKPNSTDAYIDKPLATTVQNTIPEYIKENESYVEQKVDKVIPVSTNIIDTGCILPDLPSEDHEKKGNKFMITINQDGMVAINIAPEDR